MGLILCATRGGESSYRTQQAAITLAKERGDTIAFLYIIDLHFLDKTAAPIVVDIESELEQMGRFFLLMAKERATEQGIEVETMVHKGAVREEILKVALEKQASTVVLGRPAGEQSAFGTSSLKAFAEQIERETGAQSIII